MSSQVNFPNDPYLQYQPAFAYTLPVQLLCAGITLTLLCILGFHLLFTVQYHYPLAPLNYCLQLSSLISCLVSVLIKVIVILRSAAKNGDEWPYSIVYTAVSIPPPWWNQGQNVMWFFLQALCLGLSNITHIHFLTLLYPSRTEARLITVILGPFAIASSGLVFVALSNSQTGLDIGDAIRNVLNSTLLLIFTIALFIWGLVVNRRRAWRNDGGTAMFGFGSLLLAVVSTTCNFVAVVEDGIDWLQHLLLAAVLWQIWLGWWWWVGSGMGIGEVEDIMERAERKKRKAAKRAARSRPSGMPKRTRSTSLAQFAEAPATAANAVAGFTSSVTGILRNRSIRGNALTRRRTSQTIATGQPMGDVEEGIETPAVSPAANTSGTARRTESPQQHVEFSSNTEQSRQYPSTHTNSETSSTSQTPSLHQPRTVRQFMSFPTTWLQIYLRRLRHAHEDAAKKQVMERAEKRQKVFGTGEAGVKGKRRADRDAGRVALDDGEVGWGLGSFGIKEHQASARRLREAEQALGAGAGTGEGEEGAVLGESSTAARARLGEEGSGSLRSLGGSVRSARPGDGVDGADGARVTTPTRSPSIIVGMDGEADHELEEITRSPREADGGGEGDGGDEGPERELDNTDWEDMDSSSSSGDVDEDRDGREGWSLWGAMRNWRRRDKATF